VLLDNLSLDDLRRAVAMIGGRAISEASGRVASRLPP
jgi:nicotinate-nucleotide pyrophosphorylase (carboxylating)